MDTALEEWSHPSDWTGDTEQCPLNFMNYLFLELMSSEHSGAWVTSPSESGKVAVVWETESPVMDTIVVHLPTWDRCGGTAWDSRSSGITWVCLQACT